MNPTGRTNESMMCEAWVECRSSGDDVRHSAYMGLLPKSMYSCTNHGMLNQQANAACYSVPVLYLIFCVFTVKHHQNVMFHTGRILFSIYNRQAERRQHNGSKEMDL